MTALTLNDRPVNFRMDPQTPLLWAIRDAANLTGTKYGCGTGECGACIVDVDGVAQPACQMTLAAAEGRIVTTIEGLSRDRSHPLQQALAAENASQCGFCMPGIIMAASVLLKTNPNPAEADIAAAITNICRCGSYPRLTRAIMRAARIARGDENVAAAPPPGIRPADAARTVPAMAPPRSPASR